MKYHGELEVEVVSGENLTDRDNCLLQIVRGDLSDMWVTVRLGSATILTSGVRKNAVSIVWGERVILPVCEAGDYLNITVWAKERLKSKRVGNGRMQLGSPHQAWRKDGPVHLNGSNGCVNMKIMYTPAAQARSEDIEVSRAYFPMHNGGTMTFYQDAHTGKVPGITEKRENAFEAMAAAIRSAKKLIYITGWSLWTGTRLERGGETLGELLKGKAREGVRVLLLIWNEKFSAGLCAGLVGTFDEDTDRYFDKTGVYVEKVRRKRDTKCAIREKIVETIWSHHQKIMVADDGKGDLVAFFGGQDMTKGRWDTPEHQLFTTLATDHKDDFHNGYISVKPRQGPREPWHDVHGRLTGRAAIDLLRNFEERWRRQVPGKVHLLVQTYEDDLIKAQEGKDVQNGTVWQMQVVRSIDGDSAEFNSARVGVLNMTDGRVVDSSVHRAFVRLVRKAERFLYIESQYFIGSAQAWSQDQDSCARNLVPLEIVQRVVTKIRACEAFRVYLVLPLLPEGHLRNPVTRSSAKAILHFQYLTIQMMYRRIAEALCETGSDLHPTDYLLVLCLGKKESRARVRQALGGEEPRRCSEERAWRDRSRFLIYVHSKMALADDTHVIIGSANMNERSMDGTRDTEVAVSARQVRVRKNSPKEEAVSDGDVAMLRRCLWAEHTSGLSEQEKALSDPASLCAIRRIRNLADESLSSYVYGDPDVESRSRFMRFPLEVSREGEVRAMEGTPTIPDFDIPVEGAKGILPPISLL